MFESSKIYNAYNCLGYPTTKKAKDSPNNPIFDFLGIKHIK